MDLMSWEEYRRRHGWRDDQALRDAYNKNVLTEEGGRAFQEANTGLNGTINWRNLAAREPGYAGNENFRGLSYDDFVGQHGGQSTARLGALYKRNRGEQLTTEMRKALAGASGRALGSEMTPDAPSQAPAPRVVPKPGGGAITGARRMTPGGGAPVGASNKPVGKPGPDKPPTAPRAGTRVSPGSVPPKKRRGGGS